MRVRRCRPPRRPLFPDNGRLGGRGDVVWIFSSIQRWLWTTWGFVLVLLFPHQGEASPAGEQLYLLHSFLSHQLLFFVFSISLIALRRSAALTSHLCYNLHLFAPRTLRVFCFPPEATPKDGQRIRSIDTTRTQDLRYHVHHPHKRFDVRPYTRRLRRCTSGW